MRKLISLLLLAFIVIAGGCKKKNDKPVVKVPIAPTSLTATVVSSTQINLSWTDNSDNETGFKVERKSGSGAYTEIATTSTGINNYSDNGLASNTVYSYRVISYNSAGNAAVYSNEATATTQSVPLVQTTVISAITTTTATSGGTISADGGSGVSVKGIVWSTTTGPTVALTTKTTDGTGTSAFTSNLTALTPGTTYYVRAYATNAVGTGYGNEISFTTTAITLPVLTTTTVSSITSLAASSGGNITNNGGAAVTARGICWSTTTGPTIALSTKTSDGTGSGSFTSGLTSLAANTTYYVRAYATNTAGTAYGNELSFKTSVAGGTVTDADGNIYHTVIMGGHEWMVENLKVTHYRNGDLIPVVTDAVVWGNINNTIGYTCVYNNDNASITDYGRLYNWFAANDARGLAPAGWHIPTDDEWRAVRDGAGIFGGDMKAVSNLWLAPNVDATNSTGFTVLPGGFREFGDGSFQKMHETASFWSSTEFDINRTWYYNFYNYVGAMERGYNYKWYGYSVRCIKDY